MQISSCIELVLIAIPCGPSSKPENTHQLTVIKCFVHVSALSHTACCKELGNRHFKSQLAFGAASNWVHVDQGCNSCPCFYKCGIMQSTMYFIILYPQLQSQTLKYGWCISRAKRHYPVPLCAVKAVISTFTSHSATPVIDLAIVLLRTKLSCYPECGKIWGI